MYKMYDENLQVVIGLFYSLGRGYFTMKKTIVNIFSNIKEYHIIIITIDNEK